MREAGSVAISVIVATSVASDAQVDLFIDSQLKQSSSNFSYEKMREVLTNIFLDELIAHCKLLSNSDKPTLEDDCESEYEFLEMSLNLTEEASSSYKVIIQTAERFAKCGLDMSQQETHQLITKTHLVLH